MRRFVLMAPLWFILLILSGVMLVVEFGIMRAQKRSTRVTDGITCTYVSAERYGDHGVKLNLDCAGERAFSADQATVIAYMENPGKLTCTVYQAGNATCKRE